MIKFRVAYNEIEKKEVTKETKLRIWFIEDWYGRKKERCENKKSSHQNWFDTWEDAHDFLIEGAQKNVDNLRERFERAKGRLWQTKRTKREDTA